MRRCYRTSSSTLISVVVATFFLLPVASDPARASARPQKQRNQQQPYGTYGTNRHTDRQRYVHANNDVNQPDYYYYDDEGSCDIEVACRTEADETVPPTSMKLPIRGPRGPPGDPGRPGEDGLPGLPGLPGISAPAPRHIAFFVGLSDNIGPIKDHTQTPVIFDRVVTNVGDGYSRQTGRFTAPVNGTYQFNVVISAQGRHKV